MKNTPLFIYRALLADLSAPGAKIPDGLAADPEEGLAQDLGGSESRFSGDLFECLVGRPADRFLGLPDALECEEFVR